MIEVEGISKAFRVKSTVIRALDDVTFTVPRHSVGGLVGHNGAGKTTLIKILSTLILPDKGDARLEGISIRDEKRVRKVIGVMTVSERAFYYRLSGFDNLVFFGIVQGLSISDAKRRAKELLDLVGLSDFADLPYMKYSTGMQRKLALARALILDPPVLLLDEPTLGMDPISSRDFRGLVKGLSKEKTILMTSHNMKEMEDLADKVIILKRGKVAAQGTREEITSSIGKVKLVVLDRVPSGFEKYISGFSQGKVILRVPESEVNFEGEVIGEEDATLEDVFVYYTGEELDSARNRSRGWRRRWEW